MTSSRNPDADEVLAAIVEAVENPVGLIQLLFDCRDRQSALHALQRQYGWKEIQAHVVMDMQFRRRVQEDRELIRRQLKGDD